MCKSYLKHAYQEALTLKNYTYIYLICMDLMHFYTSTGENHSFLVIIQDTLSIAQTQGHSQVHLWLQLMRASVSLEESLDLTSSDSPLLNAYANMLRMTQHMIQGRPKECLVVLFDFQKQIQTLLTERDSKVEREWVIYPGVALDGHVLDQMHVNVFIYSGVIYKLTNLTKAKDFFIQGLRMVQSIFMYD